MELPKAEYPVFGTALQMNELVNIDLSAENPAISNIDLDDQREFETFIRETVLLAGGKAGVGGYLENRIIYRRSAHFTADEDSRCMHLGVDIWMPAGTEVFAPLDGIIHSFGINDNYADYGGTLILQHQFKGSGFWTLYGHISHSSIDGLSEGDEVFAGDKIATLGDWTENGNWPPHLHFQVILDMLNYSGDFPGVCSENELDFFRKICPDPMRLIF